MKFQQIPPTAIIKKGICYVGFTYDMGAAIDLHAAEQRVTEMKERGRIKRKRSAPQYFDYRPPPVRITQESLPLEIGAFTTQSIVDVVLYDFGAVSVCYRIPFEGPFQSLLPLSEMLYENALLLDESRTRVTRLLDTIRDAVEKPAISPFVEDYNIFHIQRTDPPLAGKQFSEFHAREIAQILRCEPEPLSDQEITDAISSTISFGPDDSTIIDWNGALILGSDMEDVIAVLEFANVELLERRYLDEQLDNALDQAYEALSKHSWDQFHWWPGSFQADLRTIAQLQVDSAILFERVTNTLKLLGDQYLARVYRLTSQRFHLQGWDASIQRKLETIESIYGKLSDQSGNRRMEVLEWIIIILIAVSILLPFIPGFPGY